MANEGRQIGTEVNGGVVDYCLETPEPNNNEVQDQVRKALAKG